MGHKLVVPVSICNAAGEPVVCEQAAVDTGADVSGLPKRLMVPLGIADSMCSPEDTGNPLMAERVDLPRLGFSINVHCAGRRTLLRSLFSEHAERAWLGLDFLQWWHVEWEGW